MAARPPSRPAVVAVESTRISDVRVAFIDIKCVTRAVDGLTPRIPSPEHSKMSCVELGLADSAGGTGVWRCRPPYSYADMHPEHDRVGGKITKLLGRWEADGSPVGGGAGSADTGTLSFTEMWTQVAARLAALGGKRLILIAEKGTKKTFPVLFRQLNENKLTLPMLSGTTSGSTVTPEPLQIHYMDYTAYYRCMRQTCEGVSDPGDITLQDICRREGAGSFYTGLAIGPGPRTVDLYLAATHFVKRIYRPAMATPVSGAHVDTHYDDKKVGFMVLPFAGGFDLIGSDAVPAPDDTAAASLMMQSISTFARRLHFTNDSSYIPQWPLEERALFDWINMGIMASCGRALPAKGAEEEIVRVHTLLEREERKRISHLSDLEYIFNKPLRRWLPPKDEAVLWPGIWPNVNQGALDELRLLGMRTYGELRTEVMTRWIKNPAKLLQRLVVTEDARKGVLALVKHIILLNS